MRDDFDPIGPYAITRWDLIVASLVITWRLTTGWMRAYLIAVQIIPALAAVAAVVAGNYLVAILFVGLLVVIISGAGLRWRKGFRSVTLTLADDGLRSDISENAGLYKWVVVRPAQVIGDRCFIPVGRAIALVFPIAVTSADNLDAVIAVTTLKSNYKP